MKEIKLNEVKLEEALKVTNMNDFEESILFYGHELPPELNLDADSDYYAYSKSTDTQFNSVVLDVNLKPLYFVEQDMECNILSISKFV